MTLADGSGLGSPRGGKNEIIHFAIVRLCEMVSDLHAKYRTDWHGGKEVA
jgi:hypothetical protein